MEGSLCLWVPIIVSLVFCALWKNVIVLLISTALMAITAVPVWWIFFERFTIIGQEEIAGWYPVIIINVLIFVILPEILIVFLRNVVLKKLNRQN